MSFEIWKYTKTVDGGTPVVSYETARERLFNELGDTILNASDTLTLTLEKVSAEEIS